MFEILTTEDNKWLYDRFHISVRDSQSNTKENLIIQNLFRFFLNTTIQLFFTVVMNFKTQRYYKEMILLTLGLVCTSFYLLFLKQARDVFDLLFPTLTIH